MEVGQLAVHVGVRAAGYIASKMGWPKRSLQHTLPHSFIRVGVATLDGGDSFTEGYSLVAAAGTGAIASGAGYTGGAIVGAGWDWFENGTSFNAAFDQRFSYLGLGASMSVGAVNSMFAIQMFQWANVPNPWSNIKYLEGAVIRLNTMTAGKGAGMAAQGAVQAHEQRQEGK